MKEEKKIKDTNMGRWLKSRAPKVLDTVADLLPDRGGLGMVKNLLDMESTIDPEEARAILDAEKSYQNEVSRRWEADMKSDVPIAKLIRPITLIALMVIFMGTMVADSIDTLNFNVKNSYVSLLEILMLTSFGAYFAGRTIEKSRK